MKKNTLFTVGAFSLIATLPLLTNLPAIASFPEAAILITQNDQKPKVELNLSAAKKTVRRDEQGRQIVSWAVLGSNIRVQPGEIIRYTVTSQNNGEAPAKELVVTQPIPQGTIYVMKSASTTNGAKITYSIDNGQSFVENPMVEVIDENGQKVMKPAPDTAYTHIRWFYGNDIPAKASAKATYQVRVR